MASFRTDTKRILFQVIREHRTTVRPLHHVIDHEQPIFP